MHHLQPSSFSLQDAKDNLLASEEQDGVRKVEARRKWNTLASSSLSGGGTLPSVVDTLIVGGGVTGLYLGSCLPSAIVVERMKFAGGKVHTTYDDDDQPLYDDGPWRIHESHKRVIALLDKYNIAYRKNTSHAADKGEGGDTSSCVDGFSTFGSTAVAHGIEQARRENIATGYDGINYADCRANVYHGQRHEKGAYFVPDKGMYEIIKRLKEACKGRVQTNCIVKDVARKGNKYEVTYLDRFTDFQRPTIQTMTADKVIVCAPPEQLHWPSIQPLLDPLFQSVKTLPLMHVYARLRDGKEFPPTYTRTPNLLSQVISGDHACFQISYSAGETANFMRDLSLNDPDKFRALLAERFHELFPDHTVDPETIVPKYWGDAVHMWMPLLFGKKSIADACRDSIEPHPAALPHLYMAGEAFSTTQGWIEGCLETADLVLDRMQHPVAHDFDRRPEEFVIVHGRVVDVERFKRVHPGSETLIQKYMNKDASHAFDAVTHPQYVRGYIFALQDGFAAAK